MNSPGIQARQLRLRIKALFWRFRWRPEGTIHRGTLIGLAGGSPDDNSAHDFRLPDGTVLAQPLTFQQLYTTFANAWRVSQATSLFDYATGEATATFTDTNFPAAALSLQIFQLTWWRRRHKRLLRPALPTPAPSPQRELDYLASGGQSSVLANDANLWGGLATTAASEINSSPPTASLGRYCRSARSSSRAERSDIGHFRRLSNSTGQSRYTGGLRRNRTIPRRFQRRCFWRKLAIRPSHDSGQVTLDLKSDGTGIDGLGQIDLGDVTVPATVTSNNVAAAAQIEELSWRGPSTRHGSVYTLDLGTIDTAPGPINLGVLNTAVAPADTLGGSFSISGDPAFTNNGFGAFSTVGITSGSADTAPTVTLTPTVAGTYTETITLVPLDETGSGNAPLSNETLTITANYQPQLEGSISLTSATEGTALPEACTLAGSVKLTLEKTVFFWALRGGDDHVVAVVDDEGVAASAADEGSRSPHLLNSVSSRLLAVAVGVRAADEDRAVDKSNGADVQRAAVAPVDAGGEIAADVGGVGVGEACDRAAERFARLRGEGDALRGEHVRFRRRDGAAERQRLIVGRVGDGHGEREAALVGVGVTAGDGEIAVAATDAAACGIAITPVVMLGGEGSRCVVRVGVGEGGERGRVWSSPARRISPAPATAWATPSPPTPATTPCSVWAATTPSFPVPDITPSTAAPASTASNSPATGRNI